MLAHRARTSLVIAGALGTLVATAILHPSSPRRKEPRARCADGICLEVREATTTPDAREIDRVVTITAPVRPVERPPLSLAVVIDRSGSMTGQPMIDAKRAAARLIEQLAPTDAFAIVTYSSTAETVLRMTRATAEAKRRATAAIETIVEDGGTCISCGLERGAGELATSPIAGGHRRLLLVSDGQANEGVYDRDELAELATATVDRDRLSISAVGVGLDFDEHTMERLAKIGRGNYHFVEDTAGLDALFTRELGSLTSTVATHLTLVTYACSDCVVEVYGHASVRVDNTLRIHVPDLGAGETRTIVVRTRLLGSLVREDLGDTSLVELFWRRPSDDAVFWAQALSELVDPAELSRSLERVRSARALDEANRVYDRHGVEAARQVLELRGGAIGASRHLDRETAGQLRRINEDALEALRTAPPTKAKKANAAAAYELTR